MSFSRFFKNKKLYLAGSAIILAGLVFAMTVSPVSAADCEKNPAQSLFQTYANPLISFAEKTIKGFGYDVVLAAAPDPDTCGSDSVGCSGASSYATISWTAWPGSVAFYVLFASNTWPITVYGTSYTLAGLVNNTTYNWAVDAVVPGSGVHVCGYPINWGVPPPGAMICPRGSFTTPNCAPQCTPSCGGCSVPCGGGTQTCTAANCSTYSQSCNTQACAPTTNITTGATTIPYNTSTTISWSSSYASSCLVSPTGWTGTSGSQSTGNLTSSQTYTITCTGPGGSVSGSVTVNVFSDFSLNNSGSIYITLVKGLSGVSSETTLTVTPFLGFSSTISLSVQSVSPSLPAGSTFSFTLSTLTSAQYSSGSKFKVNVVSGLTASQTYTIVVQGVGGGLTRTSTVYLNIAVKQPGWTEF